MPSLTMLNENQKQAATTLNRNILLLAAAGTGKTNVLSLRIAHILERYLAKPSQILCLTFTNRACKEMQQRIAAAAPKHGSGDVIVKTIHSYCYTLIKEFYKEADIASDFTIFDDEDCLELLHELNLGTVPGSLLCVQRFMFHIKEQRLRYPKKTNQEVLDLCVQEDERKLLSNCREAGEINRALYAFLLEHGAAIVQRYDSLLRERNALDFNDLLQVADQVLSVPDQAQKVRDSLRYIHIDEVQDTTLIEYQIIKKIFGESRLLLCGDFFQTIYQWRGSKPRNIFREFIAEYDPVRIAFDCNYRSTKVLLQASLGFLNHAFPDDFKELYGAAVKAKAEEQGEPILCHTAQDVDGEAEWIYQKLKDLSLEDLSRAAVLCRSNAHGSRLSQALLQCQQEGDGIAFLLTEQTQFFRAPEMRDILAFLRLCVNRYDDSSLARVLLHFAKGVGIKTIQTLQNDEKRKLGLRLNDYVHPDTVAHYDSFYSLMEGMQQDAVVIFDVESTGVNPARDEIIQIAAVKIGQKGEVIEKFLAFVTPNRPVGDSVHVHHYTDEFLKENGKPAEQVLPEFCKFIKDTVVVGHNVGYDLSILESQLDRLALPAANYRCDYDTLDLARRYYPNLSNHKLETLSNMLETQIRSSHDAMDDVLATKELLEHLLQQFVQPQTQARMQVLEPLHDRFERLSKTLQILRQDAKDLPLHKLIRQVMKYSKIQQQYQDDPRAQARLKELMHQAREIEQTVSCRGDAIWELLKTCVLSATSLDRMLKIRPRVPIITIHQAKGAEFDYVFLAGLQEGEFPSYFAAKSGNLDEERRTFYVAMTRAKKRLFFSRCQRVEMRKKEPSRFLKEVSAEFIAYE